MSDCHSQESVPQSKVCKPGHGSPVKLDAICQQNQNLAIHSKDPCCTSKVAPVNMVTLKEAANNNLNSVSKTCANK